MKNFLPLCAVHLDYHLPELPEPAFSRFDPDKFARVLKDSGAGLVTLFAKDHFGFSYCPTRYGDVHAGLPEHFLATLMARLRGNGQKVWIYYSLAWDRRHADQHPEYNQLTAAGQPFCPSSPWGILCVNTPYLDQVVLPQIEEIVRQFNPDGIFIDIGKYETGCCFCPDCRRKFLAETGEIMQEGEAQRRFAARSMLAALQEIRTRIRQFCPHAVMAVNASWEPGQAPAIAPLTDLDVVEAQAGHLPGSYHLMELMCRTALGGNRPYQAITVRFAAGWGEMSLKSSAQLIYEFALIAAHNGCISCGDQGNYDGTLDAAAYRHIGEAFRFIQRRSNWFEHFRAVRQIAILLPEASPFPYSDEEAAPLLLGAMKLNDELFWQCELIHDPEAAESYDLLIVPDAQRLSREIRDRARKYARRLLLLNDGDPSGDADCAYWNGDLLKTRCRKVVPEKDETICQMLAPPIFSPDPPRLAWRSHYPPPDENKAYPGMVCNRAGTVVRCGVSFWDLYWRYNHPWVKQCFDQCITALRMSRLFTITGSSQVHGVLSRDDDGDLLLHLLWRNTSGAAGQESYPAIEPATAVDLDITVQMPSPPTRVSLEPDGTQLDFDVQPPLANVHLRMTELHCAVLFTFK